MPRWQGKSRGTPLGYQIFIFVCRFFGLAPAYLLLRVVSFYFFACSPQTTRPIYRYFKERHGWSWLKSLRATYRNNFMLGQAILDKIVIINGLRDKFTYEFEKLENIVSLSNSTKGGILLSAHVGNWDMAAHQLTSDLPTLNVVMFDGEHERIKKTFDQIGKRAFNIIVLKEDNAHVFEIGAALARHELVCLHADRFLEGNKTMCLPFLGKEALFPAGPFMLAAGFNVPVSFVYAFKETSRHYHYFGSKPLTKEPGEDKKAFALRLAQAYVADLENKLKRYPEQWYNYYDFWAS